MPHLSDSERGTRQCLALEHRGCTNWTSGSVASVQINREAAQESSSAVRGISGRSVPPSQAHSVHIHEERAHTHTHNSHSCACRNNSILIYGCISTQRTIISCSNHTLPDRTLRLRGRGAIPGRAQLSHSPGTTCLWPHRKADPR